MNSRIYLIILILFALPPHLRAQDNSQDNSELHIYEQAVEEYKIGRIEQAKELLEDNIASFTGTLKVSVYRMLALCSLGLDETNEAEHYTDLMLREDPYYTTSVQDPQRFAEMVRAQKAGDRYTITTASSQAEDLREVPVPTTLITEEMIHNSGARNLQEVLAAYVPGMNLIDCNDDINIAMRGIYSNGQEKILIMLNGHLLNSDATNVASPDVSISLEKIKQIEVLRGPASSLYGGVALTAVVNLITKQGADVDGVKLKAGVGNYGQMRGDLLFGKRYFDLDLLVWGSIYKTDGEERDAEPRGDIYGMPEKTIKIGRIGNNPSYDFGIQLNWRGLQFLYDTHFSQVVAPYTISTLATSYAHDKYKTFNNIFPSFATNSHHADMSYSRQLFGKLHLTGSVTYDNSDLTRYQVIYDYPMEGIGTALSLPESIVHLFKENGGLSRYINGQEVDLGFRLKGDFNYIDNDQHQGSLAFGAEYNRFELSDVRYLIGYNFVETIPENHDLQELGKGQEFSYNAYMQLKHKWRSLIINGGMRYDYKKRSDGTKLYELSPRIALILLRPKWNAKFSYSKSFVDAPYVYRKINEFTTAMTGYSLESDYSLSPERIHSLQFSFAGTGWVKGLDFEINTYYNHAQNLIMTHFIEYDNAGENKTTGIELMAKYRHQKFTADFNFTWTHTFRSNLVSIDTSDSLKELVDFEINTNNNTPVFMSNAVLSWQTSKRLKLYTHLLFEGKQTTYNTDIVQLLQYSNYISASEYYYELGDEEEAEAWYDLALKAMTRIIYHEEMPARLICNVGAEYQIGKVTLGLNVRNLFNTEYSRSGMNTKLIPQRGLWWMFNIAYHF